MPPKQKAKIEGLLGPEVGYVDLIDNALLERQAKEQSQPSQWNPLRPSAAGKCARALAYEFHEYRGKAVYEKEVRKPSIIRLLNLGHSIEYHMLRMMGDVEFFKVKYKQQVLTFFPISETERIEGSIDFVIYAPQHRAVGDVKSKGDKFYQYKKTKWDMEITKLKNMASVQTLSSQAFWVEDLKAFLEELDDPFFADNFLQLNLYACNSFMQERGIDHAFILRYNKNDSRVMEVRFKPSPELAAYVEKKFTRIAQTIDTDQSPEEIEKEFDLGSIRCAFCQFASKCHPGADALKAFFATFRNKRSDD